MNKNKRLLTIEDDADIRDIITDFLTDEGYTIIGAGKGAEALHLLKTQSFNLIILDMGLPDMTGNDVLKAIPLQAPAAQNLPVIVVTANPKTLIPNPQVRELIPKPFDLQTLLVTVQQHA